MGVYYDYLHAVDMSTYATKKVTLSQGSKPLSPNTTICCITNRANQTNGNFQSFCSLFKSFSNL